jgi:hypothetical protein
MLMGHVLLLLGKHNNNVTITKILGLCGLSCPVFRFNIHYKLRCRISYNALKNLAIIGLYKINRSSYKGFSDLAILFPKFSEVLDHQWRTIGC